MTAIAKKQQINTLISEYFKEYKKQEFIPGQTMVRYAGAVINDEEVNAAVSTLLDGWLGLADEGDAFEKELAAYVGTKHAKLTNSGSSANLLAVAAMKSWQFPERLEDGDEVITAACSFPTTVSAIVHNNLIPVFLDCDPNTYNLRVEDIEKAISPKTKMIFVCHTLGNPNEMDKLMELARERKLHVIEDNCDALGSLYDGKKTGSFGIMATESFYPAHHITMGEGGAVLINEARMDRIVQSLRDWGRACWCGAAGGPPLGTCGVRFNFKIDNMPYDHKYIFSHIGYNLKPIELQAAMGRIQLKKFPKFRDARKKNFAVYEKFFTQYEKFFILPKSLPKADPCWFSFPLTLQDDAPFTRMDIVQYLESHHVQTRPTFSGNILRQPGYKNIEHRVLGPLVNSDRIFKQTFFIGTYPGLTAKHLEYVMETFTEFLKNY
jgi:CDP-6-deoxy-D-xylo-4-hexulose-3-dehydrase